MRKILRVCKKSIVFVSDFFFFYPFVAPLILFFLLLLRPFILIRACLFRTDALGHTPKHYEMYLCEKDQGIHPPKTLDLFFPTGKFICNQQIAKMWKRELNISQFTYYIFKAAKMIPHFNQHVFESHERDIYGIFNKSKRHLFFTKKEEERGIEELKKIGIENEKYVCIYARDKKYKETIYFESLETIQ